MRRTTRKKLARWNKIYEASAKQSRRGKIPKVKNIMNFKEAINNALLNDLIIIPYEKEEKNNSKKVIKSFKSKSISIFIGPEGGFSDTEISFAIYKGLPITIGKRILRTETAGFVSTSILLYELES